MTAMLCDASGKMHDGINLIVVCLFREWKKKRRRSLRARLIEGWLLFEEARYARNPVESHNVR